MRNEKGEVTTDITEIPRIKKDDYELCAKNGQPRRNGQILRKVQSPKTEPGINK